jgi:hypothetical protein
MFLKLITSSSHIHGVALTPHLFFRDKIQSSFAELATSVPCSVDQLNEGTVLINPLLISLERVALVSPLQIRSVYRGNRTIEDISQAQWPGLDEILAPRCVRRVAGCRPAAALCHLPRQRHKQSCLDQALEELCTQDCQHFFLGVKHTNSFCSCSHKPFVSCSYIADCLDAQFCLLLPEDPTLPGAATERCFVSGETRTDRHVKAGSAIQMTLYT